jgi:uracil-DNA glycosylase
VRISKIISCAEFPCGDIEKQSYCVPSIEVTPEDVRAVMVSESAPQKPSDYYYARGEPLYAKTTLQAFKDAGSDTESIDELLGMGFYFTTAVKCGKVGYGVGRETIRECSKLLERELELFPRVRAIMLMGDVAIKAFNEIAKRRTGSRAIPAGSTYKIRGVPHFFNGIRLFPSYLQAGPSFFIEASKRRMISQDIAEALRLLEIA